MYATLIPRESNVSLSRPKWLTWEILTPLPHFWIDAFHPLELSICLQPPLTLLPHSSHSLALLHRALFFRWACTHTGVCWHEQHPTLHSLLKCGLSTQECFLRLSFISSHPIFQWMLLSVAYANHNMQTKYVYIAISLYRVLDFHHFSTTTNKAKVSTPAHASLGCSCLFS